MNNSFSCKAFIAVVREPVDPNVNLLQLYQAPLEFEITKTPHIMVGNNLF
jgi:hypothetical protein